MKKIGILVSLSLMLFMLVLTPVKTQATSILPGVHINGPYGPTCVCPMPFWWNCTCVLQPPVI